MKFWKRRFFLLNSSSLRKMICYAYCWCEVFYFEQCNMYSLTQLELLRIKLNRTCFVLFLVVVVHHACRAKEERFRRMMMRRKEGMRGNR